MLATHSENRISVAFRILHVLRNRAVSDTIVYLHIVLNFLSPATCKSGHIEAR